MKTMVSRTLLSLAVTTFVATASFSQDAITINLAHGTDPVHPWNQAAEIFAKQVSEESGGQISVNIFTAGQMGGDREMLEATQSGSLQMSVMSTMAMSGFEPSLQIFDLPYLFSDYDSAYKILDGEIGEKAAEPLIGKGVRNLAYWENDYRQLSNNVHPIETVEDLKGMKIRVPETPILIAWLENLGAIPTPIAYTELYTALQQGVVDGQDNGILISHSAKYNEVQDYYTLTQHIYAPAALLINENFYQALSEDNKEIIKNAAEAARDYQRELSAQVRGDRLQEMKDTGLQVTVLSDEALKGFKESGQPVYEQMKDVVNLELVRRIQAMN